MDLGQDLNFLTWSVCIALDFIFHFSKGAPFLQQESKKHIKSSEAFL